ncbi:MAG: TonB-dependent receptor [Congregibacter sp.]
MNVTGNTARGVNTTPNITVSRKPLARVGRMGMSATLLASLAAGGSAGAAVLEEVVVTAQKRAESLQEVPVSVAVVSGEQIKNTRMNDMMDLAASLPNVTITDGVNNQNVFIRGIGSGIDRGLEQSVGMFIDGIYMGRSRQYRAPFLDLEKVAVLRGPQAVLFGKNTVAGAVQVDTAKAELGESVSGSVFSEYVADFGDTRFIGVLNAPLSDSFALRIAASTTRRDGYFYDTFKDQDELEVDENVFRLSATWEASDRLTLRAKIDYAESETIGSLPSEISLLDPNPEPFADPTKALNAPVASFLVATALATDPELDDSINYRKSTSNTNAVRQENERQEDELFGAMLHFEYELGDKTLTAITGYSEYQSDEWQDTDLLPYDLLGQNNQEDFEQWSQELRLTSPGGETVDYIVGAYWQKNSLELPYDTSFEMRTLSPFLAQVPPLAGFAPLMTWVNRETNYQLDSETWSVFGEATWNVSDSLAISLGGRYSSEQKDVQSASFFADLDDQPVSTPEELATVGLLGALGVVATSPGQGNRDEKRFSPALKITWNLDEELMFYSSAQRGYKSGGFNSAPDVGINGSEFEYEDEVVTGYELGFKSTLLNGAATLNVALFYSEFDDLQVTSFVGTTFILSNAGASISQGIEMDGRWAVTESLTLNASLAFLDAEFDEYERGPCTNAQLTAALDADNCAQDLSGRTTAFAPDISAFISANYATRISDNLELSLNLAVNYSDEFFHDGALDPATLQDSFTKVDARIALASYDGKWEVALTGNNLTDETTVSGGFGVPLVPGSFFALVDAPRVIALQASYNF